MSRKGRSCAETRWRKSLRPPGALAARAGCVRGWATAQVFANLLVNAAKFTDNGGRIGVLVEREADRVLVKVRDSGIGIPREMLPRVFDAYLQAERGSGATKGGLGLGLTLARHLVELHGGTVDAYSEGPGQGSEVVVRLPASHGQACSTGCLASASSSFAST
jgi:signal transduction histidine kinase